MPVLGTITQIKPKGRSQHRYEVWIDGQVVLEADQEVIAQGGLRSGRPLTVEELGHLRHADQALEASRLALRLLSHRARSRQEIILALRRKRYPEDLVALTLERLTSAGLLDDEALAHQMAEQFTRHRQLGRYAVYHKLRQAGLEADLVQRAVTAATNEEDELERARQVAQRYVARAPAGGDRRLRAKVYSLLQRRGFEAGLARQVTEETVADDRTDD